MNLEQAVNDYFEKGWLPFPLPEDKKAPPPSNITGKHNNPSEEDLQSLWYRASGNSNLGLKFNNNEEEDHEIIGIDIDTYDDKDGWTTYLNLAKKLGPLPLDRAPMSTRRGVESNSGQWFFRVKKSSKSLKGDLGSCIDIVQPGHRYTAAFPSVVKGKQYKWYMDEEECGIPLLSDIPSLPEAWDAYVHRTRGDRREAARSHLISGGSTASRYRGAIDWMREALFGFDIPYSEGMSESDYLSPQISKITDPAVLLDRYDANGHDHMNADVYRVIAYGTEGHKGVKAGLFRIHKAFQENNESRTGDGKRSHETLENEYQRSVYEGVNKIVGEIESGSRFLMGDPETYALRGFGERQEARKKFLRPTTINSDEISNDDLSHAEELMEFWGDDLKYLDEQGPRPFVSWDESTGRFQRLRSDQMFRHVAVALPERMEEEGLALLDTAKKVVEIAEEGQLDAETEAPEDIEAKAKAILARASHLRNTSVMKGILSQVPSIPGVSISSVDLDTELGLIGIKGGRTLDLSLINDDKGDILRDSVKSDFITMENGILINAPVRSEAWDHFLDTHLPDPEIRGFVQKVMGYSLHSGNPEKLLPVLWGPSNTGKTVMLEACSAAMGQYAGPSQVGTLFRSQDGPSPEMVKNLPRLMLTLSEVGLDEKLEGSALKRVTGNDLISARQLYSSEMVETRPKFTPYLATNTVPKIANADDATKRRLVILPFVHPSEPHRVSGKDDIINWEENLRAVMWWLIDGYKLYVDEGLESSSWPKKIIELREEFISETSDHHSFLAERFEIDPNGKVTAEQAWKEWERWNVAQNISRAKMGSRKQFEGLISASGYRKFKTEIGDSGQKAWCFQGIRLLPQA